ncbi:MAG: FG-GAP-like repeat-containing protein, partial [Bacteroidetes bacterium]|nr:FG-GAP-like repeat-containing protein [Bacteroidota bacterium]
MKKEIPILVLLSLIGLSRAFAQVITYSTPSKIIHIAANDSSANFGDDPANYYYGASEYCVGHFNNDIYDDLVVLAPNWKNVNGIILGKAYIYYGSPAGISNTPSLEIAGVHDLVGFHTVLTGDFNNDSYDDLVLTAHNYQSCGGVQNGYAVVYFSKPDGTGIDALTFTELNGSGSCGINFGVAVAKGDVNGDGKTDLVVSAIHESGYSGRLYVYYGKSNFVNTPDKILSRNGSTILGICYLNCGDVNGDNFDDIISVDMPSWNENNKTLSVFPGGTSMNTTPAYTRVTGMYGGWTALGDINNDGIKDIIRSSHFCYGFGAGSSATINIIKGATNFDINNELSFTFSSGTTSMISFPVATGDVNNDGINDVFASILYPNGSKESFVFAGDAVNYLDINDTLIRFTDTDNTYGNAIENVIPADMNGDGKFEFYGYSRMLPYKGVIFVYGIYVLPPVATPGASCGPGLVSLTASGASGSAQYYWYSSDTSQTALATGPVFITPFISQNSTYYVAIDSSGVFSQRVPVQATINALPADIGQPGGFMPSLQNGLVAHYPMDGNANDASGNGNTGINHGATATAGHCGNAAGAMSFNGSSNWIEVPNSSSLQSPNTGFSMSSWVKSGISYIPFLCKINGPSYNIYQYRSMYDISSQGCWLGMNGTDYGSTITSPVSLNTWFHYTVTYDGSVIRYYINGVLNNQSNVAISINPNSQRLEIARDAHGPVEWLNGALDEMRIYNRALTSQEVVSLSAGCSGVAATLGNDTVCAGNNTSLNIQNSQSGIKYQVLQNGANYGTFQTGNGNTLTFPVNGLMQTASFTMLATNPATGCFIVLDSVFIVHVSAPDAVVSPPATICSGSNTTLTASGGLNYLWSNGATTAVNIVSPLATTNYHVTVTSPSGCTDVDSVTVTVIPSVPVSVTVTASANPVCQGDTVQYTAHMANAGSNAALQWYVNGLPVYGNSIINGLVAHYPFNGTLADATGNSQNAVEHGNVSWTTDRFGNPNSAYNIGGNPSGSDYLTVANSSALAIQNPFTVSVWVNKEVHGGWILNKGRDIINGYGMYDGGGNAQVVYAGNNGAYVTNTSVSLNQWHLYTCVFKGDSASFYLDGTLADKRLMASSSYVSSSPDYPLAIGRHFTYCCYDPSPSYWSYPFKGKVDDVRLYNRSLSAVEVWQLYKGFDSTYSYVPQNGDVVTCVLTATGTCLSNNPDTSNAVTMVVHPLPANLGETTTNLSQGLVAYYPFNGNANDESGNGNNGFVSGAIPATDRCGNANKAFRFDGINDVISTPVSGGFTNEITLCAWYKADGNQNNMSGIVSSRSGYYQENGLGVQNSSIGFWLVNDNGGLGYSVQLDYQWHFIAGTYKNGLTKLFYDNQLVASRNGIVNFTVDQAFLIGYDNYTGADRHFFGSLDKIQIYNRGLTDNEIANLYSESCYNLAASLSIDSICVGNNTSLNILHSQPVVNYQMLHNGANYGTFQTGNGNTLTFPINGLMQTTSFTVLATNTTTGCYTILDSTFTVHVSALNAVVSPAATICSGTPAILTASGGTGYLWSNGMTTPVITVSPLATTVYYVTV